MIFEIYYEKPQNGNPYYSNNDELKGMTKLISQIEKSDLLKDRVVFRKFSGGHRNPSPFECHLELEIIGNLSDEDKAIKELFKLIDFHKANYKIGGGINA